MNGFDIVKSNDTGIGQAGLLKAWFKVGVCGRSEIMDGIFADACEMHVSVGQCVPRGRCTSPRTLEQTS